MNSEKSRQNDKRKKTNRNKLSAERRDGEENNPDNRHVGGVKRKRVEEEQQAGKRGIKLAPTRTNRMTQRKTGDKGQSATPKTGEILRDAETNEEQRLQKNDIESQSKEGRTLVEGEAMASNGVTRSCVALPLLSIYLSPLSNWEQRGDWEGRKAQME